MSTASRQDRSWSKKARPTDPSTWDAIIIGSGMGGMTTAAILAAIGKRVLVLEQHYVPGGFTHMFKRPGYVWDVGVHAVGEVTEHSLPGRILKKLSHGKLEWASLGPAYDEFYYPDNFHIDFPDSPKQFTANLKAAFPQEGDAIDRYVDLVKKVSREMASYYLARSLPNETAAVTDWLLGRGAQEYLEMNTGHVIDSLTQDPKLRAIMAAQWGYYGSPPSRSSFAMQALVVKHFLYGGYYPVGGAKEIANHLLKTVADAGGWTRISTPVQSIVLENGRAVGVRLESGEELRAHSIISAAGVLSTVRRLLPPDVQQQPWVQDISALAPAPAHVCLYLGMKGDIRQAGVGSANKWFYRTWDANIETWILDPNKGKDQRQAPVLYCSFPSLKDPLHDPGPEQRHTGEVVTFVPWHTFEPWLGTRWQKRGPDYSAFKEHIQSSMLEQFLTEVPGLRDMIDHVEMSTPLSTDNFCRPMRGSIYGLEPTPARFRCKSLRPRSPIKGLYFSGSEVASAGVMGAMLGGVLCALAVEPWKALRFVRASM
jgi:all-trans-retinol 13,14-reductase